MDVRETGNKNMNWNEVALRPFPEASIRIVHGSPVTLRMVCLRSWI